MVAVAHMDKVRAEHTRSAAAHRKAHQDALLAGAIRQAEQDPTKLPGVPQIGAQGADEGFWEVGAE